MPIKNGIQARKVASTLGLRAIDGRHIVNLVCKFRQFVG
jgi:hypothetical protein